MTRARGSTLRLVGLSRSFGAVAAVDGVSLRIREGERHALLGANGAGKTTLLNMAAGSVRPTSGTILWQGRDITRWGPARRAVAGIGRTFQSPTVFAALPALDNVVLGAWPHWTTTWRLGSRYRRLAALAMHQLETVGFGDLATIPAGQLSYGQRRLLDIVVALAGKPRLLLLDEPAAGLHDSSDLLRLHQLLTNLPAAISMVLVEHRIAVVEAIATTVTLLDRGRILSSGSLASVRADPTVLAAYPGIGISIGSAGHVAC